MILPDFQGKKERGSAPIDELLFQRPVNPLVLDEPINPHPGVPPEALLDQLPGEPNAPLALGAERTTGSEARRTLVNAAPSHATHRIIEPGAPPPDLGAVTSSPRILTGAEATLGAIFRAFGGAYLQEHAATSNCVCCS